MYIYIYIHIKKRLGLHLQVVPLVLPDVKVNRHEITLHIYLSTGIFKSSGFVHFFLHVMRSCAIDSGTQSFPSPFPFATQAGEVDNRLVMVLFLITTTTTMVVAEFHSVAHLVYDGHCRLWFNILLLNCRPSYIPMLYLRLFVMLMV